MLNDFYDRPIAPMVTMSMSADENIPAKRIDDNDDDDDVKKTKTRKKTLIRTIPVTRSMKKINKWK